MRLALYTGQALADVYPYYFQSFVKGGSRFAASVGRVFVQVIEQHVGHGFDANDEGVFVEFKFDGVERGRDAFGFVADAEVIEKAGDDLLVEPFFVKGSS